LISGIFVKQEIITGANGMILMHVIGVYASNASDMITSESQADCMHFLPFDRLSAPPYIAIFRWKSCSFPA
jgi:hypothetical protein